ncbi:AraC family transcriptional regulator [Chitinophaga eiseniae]|uniref:AraC family transcriptional regulator n=1 Tax=Chitinophaga eiseniae TaxID=634771 RepID=A0A847SSV8_9BACT|nr:helix-turn-helix transcriptional regulator [Chitinophaga eiseniae]NLR82775.1 AraC family transcriptional regulator [Chitinophaga eiseniae]
MNSREQITQFFTRHGVPHSPNEIFQVQLVEGDHPPRPSSLMRRDYYKIALLLEGEAIITYADRSIQAKSGTLIFSNPLIPYAWQRVTEKQRYYYCLFTEAFLHNRLKREIPAAASFFKVQGDHILFPDTTARERIIHIFDLMLQEAAGDYAHKHDVWRSHLQLLIHEAHKIMPPDSEYTKTTSAARITELFLELLARQFPLSDARQQVRLKAASEFAAQLSLHVNYLNKSVKAVTGHTTTELIAQHMAKEARAMLQNTRWDVAQIGYCLGFGHASNFNAFFRRMTGETPHHFREKSTR